MRKTTLFLLSFSLVACLSGQSLTAAAAVMRRIEKIPIPTRQITTIFGPCDISHPLVQDLLNHAGMQRLTAVDQHGPTTYFGNWHTFDRFTHSVGVFHLAQMYDLSFEEQIACLTHDASHTVSSHAGDHVHGTHEKHITYQDCIHEWSLREMGFEEVLAPYGLTATDILPDRPEFLALKRKLPDINADRFQYNLQTGLSWGMLSPAQIHKIVDSLRLEGDIWYFTCAEHARIFANLALFFTKHFWGAPKNTVWHMWFAEALKRAIEINLFGTDTLHFGRDHVVLDALNASDDPVITAGLIKCQNPEAFFSVVPKEEAHHLIDRPKFRGIDPSVEHKGNLEPLSTVDPDFAEKFKATKKWCEEGVAIRFSNDPTPTKA